MPAFKDISGQRFGRLVAIRKFDVQSRCTRWLCQCDCGEMTVVQVGQLIGGYVRSCGCSHRTAGITHGKSRSPIYSVWHGMVLRCTNRKQNNYHNYGGRGIKVCHEWRTSFSAFYAYVGDKPKGKKKH